MGRRVALIAVAASILGMCAPAISSGQPFCTDGIIRDYARPLASLPAIRPVPLNQRVPFGPAQVFLRTRGEGELLVGRSSVGFHLSFAPRETTRHLSNRLNWLVEVRVDRIDKRGRTVEVVTRLEERVKRLRTTPNGDLALETEIAKPGLYRSEIVFSNLKTGKRLGRYGEYKRLLEPSLDAAITLERNNVVPGETIFATLVNSGTETIHYGLSHRIEAFDGTAWSPSPIKRGGPVPAIGLSTGPGGTSACWAFGIPADAPPGLYRFALDAQATRGWADRSPTPVTLSAEFTIGPRT